MEVILVLSLILNVILVVTAFCFAMSRLNAKENVTYWKSQYEYQMGHWNRLATKYDKLRTKLGKLSGLTQDSP